MQRRLKKRIKCELKAWIVALILLAIAAFLSRAACDYGWVY